MCTTVDASCSTRSNSFPTFAKDSTKATRSMTRWDSHPWQWDFWVAWSAWQRRVPFWLPSDRPGSWVPFSLTGPEQPRRQVIKPCTTAVRLSRQPTPLLWYTQCCNPWQGYLAKSEAAKRNSVDETHDPESAIINDDDDDNKSNNNNNNNNNDDQFSRPVSHYLLSNDQSHENARKN